MLYQLSYISPYYDSETSLEPASIEQKTSENRPCEQPNLTNFVCRFVIALMTCRKGDAKGEAA